jgi:lipid-A-disaccharide synthase-like uncharacterized protein
MLVFDQIIYLQELKQNDPITFWYLITMGSGLTLLSFDIATSSLENITLIPYIPVIIGVLVYTIYEYGYKQNK